MVTSDKRNIRYDSIKGLAIFLVICEHSISHIDTEQTIWWAPHIQLYLFHMSLFIFVFGYFFSARKPPVTYVTEKIKSLIVSAFCTTPFIFIADCVNTQQFDISRFFLPIYG